MMLKGIPVYVDITFLLVVLYAVLASMARLSQGVGSFAVVVAGMVAGVFLALLLHELAHALAARAFGVRTQAIWIGGGFGLALLEDLPANRLHMIIILLAGPLANAGLCLAFWLAWSAETSVPGAATATELGLKRFYVMTDCAYLLRSQVALNAGLLAVNLLPGFPLDGGRISRIVLRSFIGESLAVKAVAVAGALAGLWCIMGAAKYGAGLAFIGLLLVATNGAILWASEPIPD